MFSATTVHLPDAPSARRWLLPLATVLLLLMVACQPAGDTPPAEPPPSQGVVDSTLPIEEEVRRFLLTVDSVPAALRHGAPNREELVRRFLLAVETRDSAALPRLVLQRDEFIGLYYPHTHFTAPPYELSPSLLWFQMQNASSRGISRLLQRDGGRPLGFASLRCPDQARIEGPNRLWESCIVAVTDSAGAPRDRRLFGTILEHGGTYKFLTYTNEY